MATTTKATKRRRTPGKESTSRKWSGRVTTTSNAMDLEANIFKSNSAKKIASSVKHSAEKSRRRKGTPYQSAMSMLNFYLNRAGKNLSSRRRSTIEQAKDELRTLYKRKTSKTNEADRQRPIKK